MNDDHDSDICKHCEQKLRDKLTELGINNYAMWQESRRLLAARRRNIPNPAPASHCVSCHTKHSDEYIQAVVHLVAAHSRKLAEAHALFAARAPK